MHIFCILLGLSIAAVYKEEARKKVTQGRMNGEGDATDRDSSQMKGTLHALHKE